MTQDWVFLSYDLGINGDYEGLYSWLAKLEAKECGDSLAYFKYAHKGDLVTDIKKDIKSTVSLNPKSRVYLIRFVGGKFTGSFIFGSRREAAWASFAPTSDQTEDSNA